MALQIRCNCGWSSQVSEFYLGDAVCCPQCSTRIAVHKQSGVPYGYAPYPTWRKQPATVRLPATRRVPRLGPYDDSSRSAFGLASLAAFFVITGVFVFPGLVLAVVSLHLAARSRRASLGNGVPVPGRTKVATWLSVAVLVLCPLVFFATMPGVQSQPQRANSSVERPGVNHGGLVPAFARDNPEWQAVPEFRYPAAPSVQPPAGTTYRVEGELKTDGSSRIRQELAPDSPAPQPEQAVTPFERYQSDYSRKVANERSGR